MERIIPGKDSESVDSLDYLWLFWKIHGFYPSLKYNLLQKVHVIFIIVVVNFVIISTFVIQLFFVENLKQLLYNLPMNISLITDALKFFTILKMHKKLVGIKDYFRKLDSRISTAKHVNDIRKLIVFCKRLTLTVCFLYVSIVVSAALNAGVSNRQLLLFDVWVPYNFHDPAWVYWATFTFQFSCIVISAIQNLTNDLNGPLYFIMLNTHLKIIMERLENVGWDLKKSQEDNYNELVECIKDRRIVMNVFDIFQNTTGYVIFMQFASTALVLTMEALITIIYDLNFTELLLVVFYMLDVNVQILPCCYYSNKFMVLTDQFVTSIYSTNFPDQSPKFKKTAIIFMQMTQKRSILMAAKIVPVSLATFASIIKLSYSMLTLAKQLH
ncbi:odorant receptor 33a-like [Hermetia illucens]|nr:odorant receptor 33a-like [Hermetia illucens]